MRLDRNPRKAARVDGPRWPARRRSLRVPETLAACLALATAVLGQAEQRPEYRCEPGDHLVYERRTLTTPLDSDQRPSQTLEQVQVWYLRRQAGESLVLIELRRAADGRTEPASGVVLHLHESGRRRVPEETATRLGPLDPVLDLLPRAAAARAE